MDCIQQSAGSSDIGTLGAVTYKITVRATDDSYQMTQQRMKEAEEERKGIRQEITYLVGSLLQAPTDWGCSKCGTFLVCYNFFTPKISLVFLLTVYHTVLTM